MAGRGAGSGPGSRGGYRAHSGSGARPRRGALRYTDEEWALIIAAAKDSAMAPGAWAQQAAVHAAAAQIHGLGASGHADVVALREEWFAARAALGRTGGLVNQLVARAHATGDVLAEPLARTLRAIRDSCHALNTLTTYSADLLDPTRTVRLIRPNPPGTVARAATAEHTAQASTVDGHPATDCGDVADLGRSEDVDGVADEDIEYWAITDEAPGVQELLAIVQDLAAAVGIEADPHESADDATGR